MVFLHANMHMQCQHVTSEAALWRQRRTTLLRHRTKVSPYQLLEQKCVSTHNMPQESQPYTQQDPRQVKNPK